MTAKEKATELVDKMYATAKEDYSITFYEAIDCALIAVDEILDLLPEITFGNRVYEFWLEVKKEIELL